MTDAQRLQELDEIRGILRSITESQSKWEAERQIREEAERKKQEEERKIREAESQKREEKWKKELKELAKERQKIDERVENDRIERERERKRMQKDFERRWNKLESLFTGQWGKLIEAMFAPSTPQLFRDRGLNIERVAQIRDLRPLNAEAMEVDILLVNGDEVVAVEVKTTLRVDDVRNFLKQMDRFPEFFHEYRKGYKIYGAVAGVQIEEGADRFAYKNGLFVLSMSGKGLVEIRNDENFTPKILHS